MPKRYALYYAPEHGSPLSLFGARWLGRDAATGAPCVQPSVPGVGDDALDEATAVPRVYGFHATLKPPFALAKGRSEEELLSAVADFAAERGPLLAPRLALATVGSFLALTPHEHSPALDLLAEECVTLFDGFRAPPEAAEIMRRRAAGLTRRQEALLQLFGYPFLLDEYRFHLTLTDKIADRSLRGKLVKHLRRVTAPLCAEPLPVREICVFRQAGQGAPFTILRRYPLAGEGRAKEAV
ncbi:DUF1045 domain-containing protein [Desulfocurvus sp. DL9XJH121]